MGSLTVKYVRGKFLIGAKRISVEIDGAPVGMIGDGERRIFLLSDEKHLVVFRYSYMRATVELTLSGDDHFTVFWDRTLGGMRIAEEFEGDVFFGRSGRKYLAACAVVAVIAAAILALWTAGRISTGYALAGHMVLTVISLFLLIYILTQASRTYVWGEEEP